MTQVAVLESKDLCVGFTLPSGKKEILKNLNFKITPGEMICLMGANGCGKTTLLRSLSALEPFLAGDIFINGKNISTYSQKQLSLLVSIVLTERIHVPKFSVAEVIALGRQPHTSFWGRITKKDKKKLEEVISLASLGEIANELYDSLSDGQKQKVLIARALAQDTPIIFLDEPTTYLDIPKKMEILKLLKKIADEKKVAILFSSHDWDLISHMAPKVWVIDESGALHGGIAEDLILDGTIKHSFNHPDFYFDDQDGRFKEKIDFKKSKFFLQGGDATRKHWTAQTLAKVGYQVSKKKEGATIIEVSPKQWVILHKKQRMICKSLEMLLSQIHHFKA
ncbi:MAG: ABC transporter ATP-binding protein [Bacteriovoracaceae bacterium]|nr:ABC transporter ATP-binding protein [Bacteriovoracaceae bacterium]